MNCINCNNCVGGLDREGKNGPVTIKAICKKYGKVFPEAFVGCKDSKFPLSLCNFTSSEIIKDSEKRINRYGIIYFLINDNEIVYVGQSIRGECRIFEHDKDFTHYTSYIIQIDALNEVEKFLITKYKPKYNKRIG